MSSPNHPAELTFEHHMSDAEALMWNVEKDPWMNPSGATIAIVDRPINADEFRHRMRYAVSRIPRLRQRVAPALGRMSPPSWVPDEEFDFDFHVRHISLPKPGTIEQLHALGAKLLEDPFDRTRPLWLFVIIDGLHDGRGALFMKIHHTISDGKGMVQLAEVYMNFERSTALPPAVDLQAIIAADALPASEESNEKSDVVGGLTQAANSSLGHLVRRQIGMARRVAGEVALWSSDLSRVQDAGSGLVHEVKQAFDQLGGSSDENSGSPLWKTRSRQRRLEALRVPLADAKSAADRSTTSS
jgi:diacylglycerol O-acyltransferase / wax synthase